MQGIFQKENTDKALKYGIYRHLPTYEKIIRNLVSFYVKIISCIPFNEIYKKFILRLSYSLQKFKIKKLYNYLLFLKNVYNMPSFKEMGIDVFNINTF